MSLNQDAAIRERAADCDKVTNFQTDVYSFPMPGTCYAPLLLTKKVIKIKTPSIINDDYHNFCYFTLIEIGTL